MRTFESFPEDVTCPICGTNDDNKCTLLAIEGTEDGNNVQTMPVHITCLLNAVPHMKFNSARDKLTVVIPIKEK